MKIYVPNNVNNWSREALSTPPVAAPNISHVFVQEVDAEFSLEYLDRVNRAVYRCQVVPQLGKIVVWK